MLHLKALFDLLVRLETLSENSADTVSVHLGDPADHVGLILTEKKRICWAAVDKPSSSLTEQLSQAAGVPRSRIEEIFKTCRAENKPLCSELLELGLVTQDALRRTLRRHTAASLTLIARQGLERTIELEASRPLHAATYQPVFTFSGPEILITAIRTVPEVAVEVGKLPPTFRKWHQRLPYALCFLDPAAGGGEGLPISCTHAEDLSFADVFQMYRNTYGLAHPAALEAAGIEPAVLFLRNGQREWLAARQPPFLCLYNTAAPLDSAQILSGILAESRQRAKPEPALT